MPHERKIIGLASGPSADGVDAVLAEFRGAGLDAKFRQLAALHVPLDEPLRRQVEQLATGASHSSLYLAELDRRMGTVLAEAANALLRQARLAAADITAIGSAGQTFAAPRHGGPGWPLTLSLGCPAAIARLTQIATVAGFAASDAAGGGDGKSPAAWANWLQLRDERLSRVLVRLGAVAELVFIPAGAAQTDVVAFDTGPGTATMDAIARRHFDLPFDADGRLASAGQVSGAMLNELLSNPYFYLQPPKYTAAGEWSGIYVDRLALMAGRHGIGEPRDLLATVTEMTARSIARDVLSLTERPHQVVLSGGGAMNIHLAVRIRQLLSPCSTVTSAKFGPEPRGELAACYAVLALARLDGLAFHCPSAGGAKVAGVHGGVYLP